MLGADRDDPPTTTIDYERRGGVWTSRRATTRPDRSALRTVSAAASQRTRATARSLDAPWRSGCSAFTRTASSCHSRARSVRAPRWAAARSWPRRWGGPSPHIVLRVRRESPANAPSVKAWRKTALGGPFSNAWRIIATNDTHVTAHFARARRSSDWHCARARAVQGGPNTPRVPPGLRARQTPSPAKITQRLRLRPRQLVLHSLPFLGARDRWRHPRPCPSVYPAPRAAQPR